MNPTPTANPLERTINFSVSAAALEQEVANRVRNLARNARLQGFRPGKAPLSMVERMYGGQVRQEVMNDRLGEAFNQSLNAQQFRLAGEPRIESVDSQSSGMAPTEFQFRATFEVYPEVNLGDLSAQTLIRHQTTIDEADVDRTLETLRKQRTTYAAVERSAANGDRVIVDFVGRLDGETFEGGSADNFAVVLGEGRMLPDFEAGIVGMAAGETKTFAVAFPADYSAEQLQGKTAEFEVTAKAVSEPIVPALDENLAKTLGVNDGDLSQLRAEVKVNLEREAKKRVVNVTKDQVMDALVASADFALPRSLVDQEVARMQQQAMEDLKSRGMTVENLALPSDLFVEAASRRVKLGLIVGDIIEKQGLKPDARSVRTLIEEHAESFEQPAELVKWFYTQPDKMAEVEALVVEGKVVEWASAQMKVEDRVTAFQDLMSEKKGAE
jgi:trigger factor